MRESGRRTRHQQRLGEPLHRNVGRIPAKPERRHARTTEYSSEHYADGSSFLRAAPQLRLVLLN
jgi:hypothetical protein